jgi:hypothetical protein
MSKDYVVTIGGGFSPQGNQASLEANVLFFNQVLQEQSTKDKSRPTPELKHQVYFADGFDPKSDLQIIAPKTVAESPAIELLNSASQNKVSGSSTGTKATLPAPGTSQPSRPPAK